MDNLLKNIQSGVIIVQAASTIQENTPTIGDGDDQSPSWAQVADGDNANDMVSKGTEAKSAIEDALIIPATRRIAVHQIPERVTVLNMVDVNMRPATTNMNGSTDGYNTNQQNSQDRQSQSRKQKIGTQVSQMSQFAYQPIYPPNEQAANVHDPPSHKMAPAFGCSPKSD